MPGTVTVACKLPNGLHLKLYKMEDHDEPLLAGGYKTVSRAVPEGTASVKINGFARYVGKDAPHEIRNGVGLTFGVDADFFGEWIKRNKDMEIVKNGLIFAQTKPVETMAQSRDHRTFLSGLEPINAKSLPLEFKGKIETADVA